MAVKQRLVEVMTYRREGCIRTAAPGAPAEDGFYGDLLMAKPPMPAVDK